MSYIESLNREIKAKFNALANSVAKEKQVLEMEIEHLEERIRDFKRREAFWRRMKTKQAFSPHGILFAIQSQSLKNLKNDLGQSIQSKEGKKVPRQTAPAMRSSLLLQHGQSQFRSSAQLLFQTPRADTISAGTLDSMSFKCLAGGEVSNKIPLSPQQNFIKSKSRVFEMINKMIFGKDTHRTKSEKLNIYLSRTNSETDHQETLRNDSYLTKNTNGNVNPNQLGNHYIDIQRQFTSGQAKGRSERKLEKEKQVSQAHKMLLTERPRLSQIASSPKIRGFMSLVTPSKSCLVDKSTQTPKTHTTSRCTQTGSISQKVLQAWTEVSSRNAQTKRNRVIGDKPSKRGTN
jgi:hypothetical protein